MSGRDDLINALTEHACCFSEEDAKRMVDAFAHELVEKQRRRGDELLEQARRDGARTPTDIRFDTAAAWYAAADLIDPQKDKP